MKKRIVKVKVWIKEHKEVLMPICFGVAGTAVAIVAGKKLLEGVNLYLEQQEQDLLRVVKNNLKLKKDGEVVKVITNRYSDNNAKTIVSRQWTKHNGELLYLGKFKDVTDLDINEKLLKRMDMLGNSIVRAIKTENS